MLAAGDEDLGPADLVGAVGLRLGPGADDAQVGAGMRLGQAHGTGPDAGVHVRQVLVLQFVAGMGIERQAGAGGQHRIQAERQVGRVDQFLDLRRDHLGHTHAAVGRITADADPAAFGVGPVGLGEAGRGAHRASVPLAAFLVARTVQRGDGTGGDLAGLFEDRRGGLGVDHFGQRRQLRPEPGDLEHLIEDEAHVAQRSFVISHVGNPRSYRSPAGGQRQQNGGTKGVPRPSLHHQHFGLVASRRDRKVYIGLLCDRHEKARFSRARASSPGVRRARRVREKPGEEAPRPCPGSR